MQLLGSRGSWARQAAIIGGLLCFGGIARAQTFTITGGNPAAMIINTAIPGQPPTGKTTPAINVSIGGKNGRVYKVTASLNSIMPPGVTLTVTITAPTGATALGPVTLDATTRDVVSNIINKTAETKTITYSLSATAAAGVVTSQSRTVTFTLTQTA
jgi:hypothetical protein